MDDDFLAALPNDPEEAFSIYEKKVREQSMRYEGNHEWFDKEAYICEVIGFIQSHGLDLGIDENIPIDNDDFNVFFNIAQNKVRIFAAKARMDAVKKKRASIAPAYLMTPPIRKEIHHYISLIREKLDGVSLSQDKKEILMSRLDAFAAEVNKDRTRLESLGSAFVFAMKKLGEGIEELKPVVDHIERIYKAIGKSEEEKLALPAPAERKQIEGPKKQIAGSKSPKDELEDEIPF